MGQTVAKSIIDSLESLGVDHVFGMPGSQNLELYNHLVDSPIKSILITNELFASFIASGYSWASGKVGVCLSIPGPGLTNMVTGLAGALVDSIPLVILVPSIKSHEKSYFLHEIDQRAVVEPIVKDFLIINDPHKTYEVIQQALILAKKGDPGPVVIEIPRELFSQLDESDRKLVESQESKEDVDSESVSQIISLLQKSEFCGIYVGRGVMDAHEELIEIAETLGAPVATTISGLGIIPPDHPLSVGFGYGPSGTIIAEDVFLQCDTILAIGCKFSEMATGRWGFEVPKKLIHVDINEDVFNKNYKTTINLKADSKVFLQELLRHKEKMQKETNEDLLNQIREAKQKFSEDISRIENPEKVHPGKFFFELRKNLKQDDILTLDCGYHQLWALTNYDAYLPRTFISSTDYQAMGFGIPSAIGAKIANPNKEVVCVCGDGGFLISGFELLTAKREEIGIKVFIFNDGELGLMKFLQQEKYNRLNSTKLLNPNFETIANSMGIPYCKIENTGRIESQLKEILSEKGTMLIDVNIDYSDKPRYYQGLVKTIWKNLSPEEKFKLTKEAMRRKNSG